MKYPRLPEHLDQRRKMLSADIAKAATMKRAGKTYAAIAREFGISETAAKYWTNPEFRERAKENARVARRKRWQRLSPQQKADDNRRTVQVLMRKRRIQPEYKEYADKTHYKYAGTHRASATRRRYYTANRSHLNRLQHASYLKHREKRLQARRRYVRTNYATILEKSKAYYRANREKILARHKARRQT